MTAAAFVLSVFALALALVALKRSVVGTVGQTEAVKTARGEGFREGYRVGLKTAREIARGLRPEGHGALCACEACRIVLSINREAKESFA